MCTGFPRPGVLRRLRPAPDRSAVGAPSPTHPPAAGAQGKIQNGSRVHCGSLNEGGARLCPCGIAAGTPQPFPAASLAARAHHHRSSLPRSRAAGARRIQPRSTRFELAPHQGDVTRRFLSYSSPSRSPDPNHLAVLARPGFVRAAPTLPAPPGSGCPQLHRPAATGSAAKVSHLPSNHSASRRTHDLRHTAASVWLASGADPKVVQRVLGHATAAMTMDLYGHVIDRNLWDAAQRLGGTTGARPDEGPDDEGGALAKSER
jgi:hypothetical protein